MQVHAGDVSQVGRPDHPDAEEIHPAAGHRQVGNLEYRHVAAATTAPLKVPACSSARLDRRHNLDERIASREHGIAETEPCHSRISERLRPAENPSQLGGHLLAVGRHQSHLAQTWTGEHTFTVDDPVLSGSLVYRRVLIDSS